MSYKIESKFKLSSEWLPAEAFSRTYSTSAEAVAIAIEGVDDPAEQEVLVVHVETGAVWRSTDEEYE